MAASSVAMDNGNIPPPENWDRQQPRDSIMHAPGDSHPANGAALDDEHRIDDDTHVTSQQPPDAPPLPETNGNSGPKSVEATAKGEKLIKPNKVYIGGLPEHTRKEDLENCFKKIGKIVNIELKLGYGFVEFDKKEAAEESVAKYHDGYFMGNKIRVELSRGGGRTAKYGGDPGACFKCGQVGHWARECPNHSPTSANQYRPGTHPNEAPLIDRIQPPRDYPPRDYPPYRDDYTRYPPPPRDARYYDYPPPPGRDYRRPPSPARDYRDYPARSSRELDDYRARGGPPAPPPARYESRPGFYPPENEPVPAAGYPPRVFGAPSPREYYDRYDRRAPYPPADRYGYPPAPASGGRPRSPPPGVAARGREEYERPPAREYPPAPAEYRGRPISPPPARYPDYPRAGSEDTRYRRRSQSPPPRSNSGSYETGYPPTSGGAPPAYNGASGYAGNGYPAAQSSSRGSTAARDYPPPPRSRDGEPASYRRN